MRSLLLPVAVLAFVTPAPADEEKKRANTRRIAALILKLGDREYTEREAAGKELVALGESALPAVRHAAVHSEVLEVSTRARVLVRTILLNCRKSPSSGLELCLIDPLEISMGSPTAERGRRADETAHPVNFDRPFLLGKYEVTQDEYKKQMGVNPSWFAQSGGGREKVGERGTGKFPVEQVTWYDAVEFCNRLSKADGLPEYYTLTAVKIDADTSAIVSATVKVTGGSGFRLPTEAEWEHACRAGTKTPFYFGHTPTGNEGNFKMMVSIGYGGSQEKASLGRTGKVGGYKISPWELHDLYGNAAEWCHDWYDKDYYANAPKDDPPGPDKGDHKAIRGGSWMVFDANCRSAARFWLAPNERKEYVGFRVARTP